MKNECSIVGDLLALWLDGLVSEDTAAFVEEHLARCAACRARLEQLRVPAAPLLAACLFSSAVFGTANFVSAAAGLARVTLLNEPWAEIAREPKVVLAAPETDLTDYMAARGFAENEQERMGALRVFEKDGAKEYVLCSVNRWFARWVW